MSKIKAAIDAAKKAREAGSPDSSVAPASSASVARREPSVEHGVHIHDIRRVTIDHEVATKNKILIGEEPHPAQGAYRMLRTRLMHKKRSHGWKILGISSIYQNEGKSYTAINLAISIAAEIGQEVVLLDLDLRRPTVQMTLGIDKSDFLSVSDYLQGSDITLKDLMVCPNIERLGCILSANALPNPSDILASPYGQKLFDELRTKLPPETIVIADLPPLFSADDALAVAPMIDGLLLVVAEGYTRRNDLLEAQEMVHEFNVIGTVLNKSVEKDDKRTHYYY